MMNSIEYYLTQLVVRGNLDPGDSVLLNSIARQIGRGIALTDRQHELVKSKLKNYEQHFKNHDMNDLDTALETLQMPLRKIDRSQTITVEDDRVVVRFPFNKKTISQLESIANKYRSFYFHARSTNEHKFQLYEPVINELVELFKNKNFVIDPWLLEASQEIENIKNKEYDFVAYINDNGLHNLPANAVDHVRTELGDFTSNTMIKYWDRSVRYGYKKAAKVFADNSQLAEHFANRNSQKIYIDPAAYTVNELAQAIKELDRFPLLVTLSRKREFEQLRTLYEVFDFVDPSEQIVLDRIEDRNDPNFELNSFIKEKKFSTWLDSNTKIAYIFKNSLPKLLVKGDWFPNTHLSLNGEREQTNTAIYIHQYCDLNVVYDKQPSYWDIPMARQLTQWV
jgi:hypothetical protein